MPELVFYLLALVGAGFTGHAWAKLEQAVQARRSELVNTDANTPNEETSLD